MADITKFKCYLLLEFTVSPLFIFFTLIQIEILNVIREHFYFDILILFFLCDRYEIDSQFCSFYLVYLQYKY